MDGAVFLLMVFVLPVVLIVLAYALVMEELSRGYASVADQCGLIELILTLLVRPHQY